MNNVEAMALALKVADDGSMTSGDVPVGAILLNSAGEVVAIGTNERELHNDPTAHAEIVAIRIAAEKTGSWRLDDHTLVVTLEPCAMCAGAISQARIPRLVFGAWDAKAGAVGSVWDVLKDPRSLHPIEITGGVLEDECSNLLKRFFEGHRERK